MTRRTVYLTKSGPRSQRSHFGIFIPKAYCDRPTLCDDWERRNCQGTQIHVVGEPLFAGYALEFKRNFDLTGAQGMQKLVLLGSVDEAIINDSTSGPFFTESISRCPLEEVATRVSLPPKGQDVRAPIDGVSLPLVSHC